MLTTGSSGMLRRFGDTIGRVLDRGFRPLSHEVKRVLCHYGLGRHVLRISDYGDHLFLCTCDRDFTHAIDYGLEREGLATFLFLLQKEDVVWDIGASVGVFAIHAASRVKSVVAFEPDPSGFERLQENVKLNKMEDGIQLVRAAVGARAGTMELQSDGEGGVSPSLADLGRHQRSVSVDVRTIDEMISDGLPHPSVMKIDIEGGEYDALRGGMELLTGESRPRLLFVEIHPSFLEKFGACAEDVSSLITQAGYRSLAEHRRNDQYLVLAMV